MKIQVESSYLPALSRLFSPIVLENIIEEGRSGYLNEVCINSGIINQIDGNKPLSAFIDDIYGLLLKRFRNEYVYKNEIARTILLTRHNLNTANMLTEFRVGKCKADVVILNSTSTGYEIKSELDSFARLEKQMQSYLQTFDHVNVITSPSQFEKLFTVLPDNVGILKLTDENEISTVRESKSNLHNIKPEVLFGSLRINEYLPIIKNYYGEVPDLPNTLIYKKCKELYCKMPIEAAHHLTVKALHQRNKVRTEEEITNQLPRGLLAYSLTIANKPKKIISLCHRLNDQTKHYLTI